MRGKGMPQHMRVHGLVEAWPGGQGIEALLDRSVREPSPAAAHKQRGLLRGGKRWPNGEPLLDGFPSLSAHWHHSRSRAFARDPQRLRYAAQLRGIQGRDFSKPQPRAINKLKKGLIAAREASVVAIRCRRGGGIE